MKRVIYTLLLAVMPCFGNIWDGKNEIFDGLYGGMFSPVGYWYETPADLESVVQWLYDYDASTPFLDNVTPSLDSMEVAGVNCQEFNGAQVNDFGVLDITTWQTMYFSAVFSTTNSATTTYLALVRHSPAREARILALSSGEVRFVLDDGTSDITTTTGTYNDGAFYRATFWFNGTTLRGRIYDAKGNVLEEKSIAASFDFSTATGYVTVGDRATPTPNGFSGFVSDFKFSETEINEVSPFSTVACCIHTPLSEGGGRPNDVTGNSNHPENTVNVPTWSTANGTSSHNLEKGYTPSIYSDGTNQRVIGPTVAGATKFKCAFRTYNQTNLNQTLIAYDGASSNSFHAVSVLHNFNGCVSVYFNGSADGYRTPNESIVFDKYYEIEVDGINETISINGVNQTLTPGAPNFSHGQGETIWLNERDGPAPNYFNGEMYYSELEYSDGSTAFYAYPIGGGSYYDTISDQILSPSIGTLETRYTPALSEKSLAAWTSTGVGDELSVTGLTGSETITSSGTAILEAQAGKIVPTTFGTAYNIKIDGELVYRVTDKIGKASTTIQSVSGSWPNATVGTGAAGLDGAWGVRIFDTSGVVVDANGYNLIGVAGSSSLPIIGNGCEVSYYIPDAYYAASTNTPNFWHDGSSYLTNDWASITNHYSLDKNLVFRWQKDSVGTLNSCLLKEFVQYKIEKQWTQQEHYEIGWFYKRYTEDCGAGIMELLYDAGGSPIIDTNGYPILIMP